MRCESRSCFLLADWLFFLEEFLIIFFGNLSCVEIEIIFLGQGFPVRRLLFVFLFILEGKWIEFFTLEITIA